MGIGSWLSRLLDRALVARFVAIELMVGLVGALLRLLFLGFAYGHAFRFGTVHGGDRDRHSGGPRDPLLMRILKDRFQFRDLVSHVLTFDYLGALGASLLFP